MAEFEQRKRSLEDSHEHSTGSEIKKVTLRIDNVEKKITELGQIMSRNLEEHLRQNNAIMQDTIISSVKAIIKEEVHLAMRDQPDRLFNFFLILRRIKS